MIIKELEGLEELEQCVSQGYSIVDCYGDFCAACVMLAPVFDRIASDMAGIQFARINVSQHMEVSEKFGINALPTILFFRDGQEVHRAIGSLDYEELKAQAAVLLYQ